ncbi:ParA family protein [uncultured Rothia sp.]|uniref:ParA family protein n=1 Tax=uncultured Rothia sp. TaxID=316088 RepID=UPI0032180B09
MPLIVSISSLKGGVGKTSVALGLASAGLVAQKKILVVDLDPHADASTGLAIGEGGTDIGIMLHEPENYVLSEEIVPSGWGAIIETEADDEDTIGSIDVVRGSAVTSSLELLSVEQVLPRLRRLFDDGLEDYDLVIIDCPPTLGRITSMAWAASDRVISIAEPSLFSVAGTERTLRAIARFEENSAYSVGSASIIVNKARETYPEHSYRIEEMKTLFADLVAEPVLPDFEEFQRIQGAAYPVHFWPAPSAKDFARRLTALLEGLLA